MDHKRNQLEAIISGVQSIYQSKEELIEKAKGIGYLTLTAAAGFAEYSLGKTAINIMNDYAEQGKMIGFPPTYAIPMIAIGIIGAICLNEGIYKLTDYYPFDYEEFKFNSRNKK